MYRIGTPDELWKCREQFPEVFLESFERASLKPLGHAEAIRIAREISHNMARPIRVLEIGHGAQSPFFDIADNWDEFECYGIDAEDVDGTVSKSTLERLRNKYSNVRFYNGYIGGKRASIPERFFDFVFSISVIEHVPVDDLAEFHRDLKNIMVPGGIQFHSYDRPWGGNVSDMYSIVESSGFEWLEPGTSAQKVWSDAKENLGRVAFEHPFNVMEKYMHRQPRDGRRLWNWVTLLMAARKPQQ